MEEIVKSDEHSEKPWCYPASAQPDDQSLNCEEET